MRKLEAICLYCGSSGRVAPDYLELARSFGRLTAERGLRLVYGGGRVGLMGAAADAALAAGGEVHGIIPRLLQSLEVGHRELTRLEVVDSMHARKMRMFEESDGFAVLPGGLGTLDEAFEMVTWRQLGLHAKPLVLLNHRGYWDPLLALLGHQRDEGFLKPEHLAFLRVAPDCEAVFAELARGPEPEVPLAAKWA